MLINYMWPFLYKSTIGETRYKIVLLKLINFSCSSKAWFTLRHKHKHKHRRKHNECSHLLHKHKESDLRKRNELQNEAVGVWDEILLLLLLLCRCQILFYPQFSYHGCIYFWDLWIFTYQYLHKSFFLFVTSKSSEPGFVVEAGIIANCLGKFLVENSILRRHFGQY